MTLTDRDRKIMLILIPVVLLLGYWFLILSPQRAEVSRLDDKLSTAQADRDSAVGNATRLQASKAHYAADYETVVKLGKAIPADLDMPSLLVQLETAAKGTHIDFDSITAGQRTAAATSSTTSSTTSSSSSTPASSSGSSGSSSGSSGSSAPPVAAGGQQAQTGPGKATENANNAAKTSDNANQAAGSSSGSSSSTATSTSSGVAGLDTVPLTFTFNGSYFQLADFFHRVKRFVRVANNGVDVKGRLMTIDGMNFTSQKFPKVTASVTATVYLAPKSEGTTAGASPQGPSTTTTSASGPGGSSSTTTSSGGGATSATPASSPTGGAQ